MEAQLNQSLLEPQMEAQLNQSLHILSIKRHGVSRYGDVLCSQFKNKEKLERGGRESGRP
ncbi:hypothetical protein GOP47_0014241 [Adiantum capillus-veneris]|uniref:Uncharacterized protein n=1 Tax=Adiantum capillus-veneris TaxID=13818 RepID=A0A9D4UL31_ADICA|nr:hypothetical protein GOP47_0014241 [Adiantum capillus-veneris]